MPEPVGGGAGGAAGGGPPILGPADLREAVEVTIDAVESGDALEPTRDNPAPSIPFFVKVTVTSQRESLRPHVTPKRFSIRLGKEGKRLEAKFQGRKDPVLGSTYLVKGEKVSGWITFEVPPDSGELYLETSLTTPPTQLPLSAP